MDAAKSKEEKEAAINAKIAAIREANAARERRHAEVEADKKLAERTQSAVTLGSSSGGGGGGSKSATAREDDSRRLFRSPYPDFPSRKPGGVKSRLGPVPQDAAAAEKPAAGKHVATMRLSEKDAPPPDPGYNFLADRMRDGGDEENAANRHPPWQRGASAAFPPPPPGRSFDRRGGPPPARTRNAQAEGVLKEIRRETASAQSRLSRSSNNNNNNPQTPQTQTPKPADRPPPRQQQQQQQPPPPAKEPSEGGGFVADEVKAAEPSQLWNVKSNWQPMPSNGVAVASHSSPSQPLSPDRPSWNPQPAMASEAPVMIGHWQQQPQSSQQQQQQHPEMQDQWGMMAHQWRESSAGSDWAEEVMGEVAVPQMHPPPPPEWISAPQAAASFSMAPPVQHSPAAANPYMTYEQSMQMLSLHHQPMDYIHHQQHQVSPQQVHNVAAALTQMSAAAAATHHHHGIPIMATYSNQQQPVRFQQQQNFYGGGRYYNDDHDYGGRRGSGAPPAPARPPFHRDREVTKIPSRFQKQKPSQAPNTYSQRRAALAERNLPRAASGEPPPPSARRLTVFGCPDVANNLVESELSRDLGGIPVRLVAAAKLEEFGEKIDAVDPAVDRFVLIHVLGDDARCIAGGSKSDVDKGAESDEVAAQFSEIVKDLAERIPYLAVAVSTLLPRFDDGERMAMSCPNNVRKVMNVEISSRLEGVANVVLVNNDLALEWWKDEVKKRRLLGADGRRLTAYGFSVMLDRWMETLAAMVAGAGLPSDDNDAEEEENGDEEKPAQENDEATEEFHDAEDGGGHDVRTVPGETAFCPEQPEQRSAVDKEETEDKVEGTPAPKSSSSVDKESDDDFKEKENDEKMEKELPKDG